MYDVKDQEAGEGEADHGALDLATSRRLGLGLQEHAGVLESKAPG